MAATPLPKLEDYIAGLTPGDTLSGVVIECQCCGGLFRGTRSDTKWCSNRCRVAGNRRKENET